MINISNLSIQYSGNYLFDDVSFAVKEKDRIGLIGRNGTGKSTLLKIILGREEFENGNITKPNNYTIGYLPQEGIINSERTVFEETSLAQSELLLIEENLKKITNQLSSRTDYESKEYSELIQKLNEENERFRILGGSSKDAEIERVLIGLGFERIEFDKKVSLLSGGWQMRIVLAKILLNHPNMILLDEPTNHLDIESIRWLENFLTTYSGEIIIVSHDRRFLDKITNRTIEISKGKIYDMNLSYSKFIEARKIQRENLQAAYNNQLRVIADAERFIERFRYKATLGSRVQSRIKQLDKIELIEPEDEDFSTIHFKFPETPRSGRSVVEVKNLSKRYDTKVIFENVNYSIERGEKHAFVGRNGEGKTTFTKILIGSESYEGIIKLGTNVEIGYYSQHQAEMLDGNSTVFETIDDIARGEMRTQVRSLLGAFLFGGDSIYKKIKVLSGGEKSRLSIARLLLQPVNFLILDEPTNHLDMLSKDVLKEALINYKGALIIVSHDREFLQELTNKTYEFRNGSIKEYLGGIDEYLEKRNIGFIDDIEMQSKSESQNLMIKSESVVKLIREKNKKFQKEKNKIQKAIIECENKISKIEIEIAQLEEYFASSGFIENLALSKDKQAQYQKLQGNLNTLLIQWESLNIEYSKFQDQSSKKI